MARHKRVGLARLIAPIPLILLGSWGLFQTIQAVSDWSRLSQPNTVLTTGEVLSRHVNSGKTTSYFLTYRFSVGQQAYQKEQMVSLSTYSRLSEGSRVLVKYAPDDPRVSSLGGGDSDDVYPRMMVITSVLFVILLIIIVVDLRRTIIRTRPRIARKRH